MTRVRWFKAYYIGNILAISSHMKDITQYMQINRRLKKEDYIVRDCRKLDNDEGIYIMQNIYNLSPSPMIDLLIARMELDETRAKICNMLKWDGDLTELISNMDIDNTQVAMIIKAMKNTTPKLSVSDLGLLLHPILYCNIKDYLTQRSAYIKEYGGFDKTAELVTALVKRYQMKGNFYE